MVTGARHGVREIPRGELWGGSAAALGGGQREAWTSEGRGTSTKMNVTRVQGEMLRQQRCHSWTQTTHQRLRGAPTHPRWWDLGQVPSLMGGC